MTRTVSASELKNNVGSLIYSVRRDDDVIIIENRGKPAAAIISIAEYEHLQVLKEKARREEALNKLRQLRARIQERSKDLTDGEREQFVEEINRDVIQGLIDKGKIRYEN